MSTDQSTSPHDTRPAPGTRAELEATQRWWLLWVYGPVMAILAVGAIVAAAAGDGDSVLGAVLVGLILGSLLGAAARFRGRRRTTGRLAMDERDESATMRTMGYAFCFAYFAALAWAVAWVGFDGSGPPEPFYALGGLGLTLALGRLCARREGY